MISRSNWVHGITVVALSIGLLGLLTGCPEEVVAPSPTPSAEDGTITVRVTGAEDHSGRGFTFGVYNEGVTDIFSATPLGGTNPNPIIGGTVEAVALDTATLTTPEIFTGGMSYVVGGIIDANADDIPSNGDYITDPLKTVVVDGDMIVEFVYPDDFVEVTGMPEPEDGTITLLITGADAHNDVDFMGAVGAAGADLNDPANCLADFVFPIVNGIGEGAAIPVGADPDTIPPPTPVTFTGGESYDVGGMIDANDDGEYTPGVDYIFKEEVENVVVDGDTILELVYPTDFTFAP